MNKLYLDVAEAVQFLSKIKPEGLWHLVAIDESNRVSAKTFVPSDPVGRGRGSRAAKARPTSTSM